MDGIVRMKTLWLSFRLQKGKYDCFGSAFTCSITDTVTEGVADADGSYEYLVFTTPLKHVAAKFGLKLVISVLSSISCF